MQRVWWEGPDIEDVRAEEARQTDSRGPECLRPNTLHFFVTRSVFRKPEYRFIVI